MNATKLHVVRSREQTIELALEAMMWAMCEESIPREVRREIAVAHASLHACRAPETVRRMELKQGLHQ